MIDSHCHLDLPAFANDLEQVIARAKQAGVSRVHIPGTTKNGWVRQQYIAQQCEGIDYSVGLHPYFLDDFWRDNLNALKQTVDADKSLRAIGEIGLDNHCDVDWKLQTQAFERQLIIAKERDMPVILHHRKSHHAIFASLKSTGFNCRGIVHAFSGSIDVAKAYIDKGFLLGVGGVITYDRARKTRLALKHVPLSCLLLETDSPDMPVFGFQGQRNEPANVLHVAKALSDIKDESLATIEQVTNGNYDRILGRT